ncbi:MAG: antibiotic biosynthesis monooxygenase [Alphaproteobacteria bacterium]|jgi:heme-degrading monooxygenase HmoA|nr:antibiotic biosynthesis monooxygenase [Alphaproteobacteria bacterium]|tara:strand:+ start:1159 stop:1476 length:318 start_codon:yes stop_codon:yes gene_type:complete
MIVRTWRGEASTDEAAKAYAEHVENTAFPKMREIPGHIGACLFSKITAEGIVVFVMSYWENMQAVQQFAGETTGTAVVEPRAQAVLESFDPYVEHFELVVKSGSV